MPTPSIAVSGLTKTFPATSWLVAGPARQPRPVHALRGLDLEVSPGQVLGLLGPNGGGKTTLLEILATYLLPTAGRAAIEGFEVGRADGEVRRRVGYCAAGGRGVAAALSAAAVTIVIILLSEQRGRTALFAAGAAMIGPLADIPLVMAGLIALREPLLLGALMPLWWWGLWAMFGAAFPASFGWLRERPALAAILGAAGGPLAYLAGGRLGAIGLPPPLWQNLLAIAAIWAVLMPLAALVSSRVVPPGGVTR